MLHKLIDNGISVRSEASLLLGCFQISFNILIGEQSFFNIKDVAHIISKILSLSGNKIRADGLKGAQCK